MIITFWNKKRSELMTVKINRPSEKNIAFFNKALPHFEYLYEKALSLLNYGDVTKEDISTIISKRYHTIFIDKKNGSKRRIDVPDEELKLYQRELIKAFTDDFHFLFPKNACAFIQCRNPKMACEVHKGNHAIFSFDIKDFFSSITLDMLLDTMADVYPFCLFNEYDSSFLKVLILPCMTFFDGDFRLPQGSPSSPFLSNVYMIPKDYALQRRFLCYTRYADDITISLTEEKYIRKSTKSRFARILKGREHAYFMKNSVIAGDKFYNIEVTVRNEMYPLCLNERKTKANYTIYGNVRMLGYSVGNEVKLRNKDKQHLKAEWWNCITDYIHDKPWSKKRAQQLQGRLNFARSVEKDFVERTLTHYEQKTGYSLNDILSNII